VLFRSCPSSAKTTDPQPASGHFRSARNHHVSFAISDIARCHTDAVRASGTGRGNGVVRTLQTQMDREEARNHVDDGARYKKRRDAPRPLLDKGSAAVLDIGQATNARTHGNTDTLTIGIGDSQPGVANRLKAGSQAVLDEEIEFARLFG